MSNAVNFRLEFVNGDITNQKADAIVSSTLSHKQMSKCLLSGQVLKKAGTEVQNALNARPGELTFGQVINTTPGNLRDRVRSIMFVCLMAWQDGNDEGLFSSVLECLNIASEQNYKSIALPALGMGGFKYPQWAVAEATLKAIVSYFVACEATSLKTVYIVLPLYDITQQASIQVFLQMAKMFLSGMNFLSPEDSKKFRTDISGLTAFEGIERQRLQTAGINIRAPKIEEKDTGDSTVSLSLSSGDTDSALDYNVTTSADWKSLSFTAKGTLTVNGLKMMKDFFWKKS
ncbi:protein mono-ADP-ribosyltransferase PARP14-like [Physella acuta]|uniref:protein mono-ADP-ribosyltransferase PARP14-like n=1 Tax=Physella acuta TaxID=109671 RepID=UPI0027DD98BC|nr:protein mono-ADP-ribosyltransferase PARP14-like [Physella acuta]